MAERRSATAAEERVKAGRHPATDEEDRVKAGRHPATDEEERVLAERRGAMAAEVRTLLSQPQKQLSPKWFYDARGAALFDRITTLPEYYLTRTERALLERDATSWLRASGARTLVELGPGSGEKAAVLLRAMTDGAVSVPVDISRTYLDAFAAEMRARVPGVRVVPLQADITSFTLPAGLPRPLVVAFLGSTIGNFDDDAARALLTRIRALLGPHDRLLLGADLRKDARTLAAAYDDAQGVTAAFNRNVLTVLNRELGADFAPAAFDHVARYDEAQGRIEMHLRARTPMRVTIPGAGVFELAAGETIRTEISMKYDRARLDALLGSAGLRIEHWFTDDAQRFALLVGAPA